LFTAKSVFSISNSSTLAGSLSLLKSIDVILDPKPAVSNSFPEVSKV
jgi:hypothetical protein